MNARTPIADRLLAQHAVAPSAGGFSSEIEDSVRFSICSPPFRVEPGQARMVIGWVAAPLADQYAGNQWLDCRLSLLPCETNATPTVRFRGAAATHDIPTSVQSKDSAPDSKSTGFEPDSQDAIEALFELLEGKARAEPQRGSMPITIRTLGQFEVRTHNELSGLGGKLQRKPMALLKALITLGGADIPAFKLVDIVWAEPSDGDPQASFDITLHRLRKLLGCREAILIADRCVSLNRRIVSLDLWELERNFATVIPLGQACVPTAAALERAAPAILDLYRGRFLPGEPDSAWLLPVRNRLSTRFHRFVMRLGDHWEAAAEWSRAVELFERAIEIEPLAEVFYCRLMVCLRAQGRRAEAIDVFRRCRQILSVTLGVRPAPATEAVYSELLAS